MINKNKNNESSLVVAQHFLMKTILTVLIALNHHSTVVYAGDGSLCVGEAVSCNQFLNSYGGCSVHFGCVWSGYSCLGIARECDTINNKAICNMQLGCAWDEKSDVNDGDSGSGDDSVLSRRAIVWIVVGIGVILFCLSCLCIGYHYKQKEQSLSSMKEDKVNIENAGTRKSISPNITTEEKQNDTKADSVEDIKTSAGV
mmetsp:Transcript_13060/g.18488  ORF Transcript_13060/g.18488 Transcript_13060/m.18488 type:complete len:200 (-) Transcript_13060:158-757(-)